MGGARVYRDRHKNHHYRQTGNNEGGNTRKATQLRNGSQTIPRERNTIRTIGEKTSSHIEYARCYHTCHYYETTGTLGNDECEKWCEEAYSRAHPHMGDRRR